MQYLSSNRSFSVWDFFAGLSQLLIRSPMDERDPCSCNIDIHFVGVRYLDLTKLFEGLTVLDSGESESAYVLSRIGSMPEDRHCYTLRSQGRDYFVVAGSLTVNENRLTSGTSSISRVY